MYRKALTEGDIEDVDYCLRQCINVLEDHKDRPEYTEEEREAVQALLEMHYAALTFDDANKLRFYREFARETNKCVVASKGESEATRAVERFLEGN